MSSSNGSLRVAITGIGAVTPLGLDAESTWQACRRGQGGIGPITAFDASHLTTQIAGQVKGFDPEAVLGKKEARRTSRCTQLALFAARQAIEDSGLEIAPIAEDVGVLVASGVGGIEVIERNVLALYNQGPRRVSPFTVPSMIIDMPAGAIAIDCGAKGVNYAIVSACSSSGHAIGEAAEWIRRGEATAIITGGTEASITNISVAAFDAMQALSTRNDEPDRASRPFDKDRDGFVMGEGAGMFVIEEWDMRSLAARTSMARSPAMAQPPTHSTSPSPTSRVTARAAASCARSSVPVASPTRSTTSTRTAPPRR